MKIRGCKTLLKFGTTTIPGFIVEETGFDEEGDHVGIEDDSLDIVADVSAMRVKNSGRVKVIPLDGATRPAIGSVFEYSNSGVNRKIIVDSVRSTDTKKGAVIWDIAGHSNPGIPLTT